ncbi:MAG: flagellar motor protein MotB [Elusimicrobiales bacterium]|nr:flagellar motor protein MotB [Elusimicrobiales bacterium]
MNKVKASTTLWMIPYAALMTNLMILFMILYAISYAKKNEFQKAVASMKMDLGVEEAKKEIEEIDKTKEIEDKLKKHIEDGTLGVEITKNKIKITFAAPILFNSGSAKLKSKGYKILEPVIKNLKEIKKPITVEGHTDAARIIGTKFKSNRQLSLLRTFSVIDFMIESGIPAKNLSAFGYGEYRPLFSNATPQGRAKNRRIEITVLRKTVNGDKI